MADVPVSASVRPTGGARVARILPALVWMAGMYYVSSIPGSNLPHLGQQDRALHFFEYLVLGFLLKFATTAFDWSRRTTPYLVAAAIGALFAATDEWHQSFVPYRHSSVSDFAFDLLGISVALIAVLIAERNRR